MELLYVVRRVTVLVSWYVTRRSGQLSFLPSVEWELSAGYGAVAVLCGWEGLDIAPAVHHRLWYSLPCTSSVALETAMSHKPTLL